MSDRFVGLRDALVQAADPTRAPPMAATMKGRFVFLGVGAPDRKRVQKPFVAAGKGSTGPQIVEDARALWAEPEREFHYVACDDLRRWAGVLGPAELPAIEALVRTNSWWDTVDVLAVHVVGTMVRRHPELRATMDVWIEDDDLWIARVALLHQLMWRGATDEARLFRYCTRRMGDRDFFVRKAIGWALRQHARVRPDRVHAFVEAHADGLSGLSKREALKRLG